MSSWRQKSSTPTLRNLPLLNRTKVVITGVGVVSPIGIGLAAYSRSLHERASGIRPLTLFDASGLPARIGGEVVGFDPKEFVRPRKSLKVMARDIQLAFTAADLAVADAGLADGDVDPDRKGVVLGCDMFQCMPEDIAPAYRACMRDGKFDFSLWGTRALGETFPLWMLRYLPNMSACHIGIAHDIRGPTNSIVMGEVSALLALVEAARLIERGIADLVLAGATGCRIHPTLSVRAPLAQLSTRNDDPASACRPFDADRDGHVYGEGAAVFVLEGAEHARRRRANVRARLLGGACAFEAPRGRAELSGSAIRRSIAGALAESGLGARDLGHVNAHGAGTTADDRVEAVALQKEVGEVPVTAPRSYFGNLGSGAGAVELVASLVAFADRAVGVTLNHERPDPACPVNVVRGEPRTGRPGVALALNHAPTGQAVAIVLAAADM